MIMTMKYGMRMAMSKAFQRYSPLKL